MSQDLRTLERAFARDPSDQEAFAALSDAYRAEGRLAELARTQETRAAHLDPTTGAVDLLWEAARIHEEAGDGDAEVRVLSRALAQDNRDPRVLERLDQLFTDREQWADLAGLLAVQVELLAARTDAGAAPLLADLEYRSGQLWEQRLSRADEALACYQRAFEADRSHAEALAAGRRIYASLGLWDGAASLLGLEVSITEDPAARAGLLRELGEIQWRRQGALLDAARTLADARALLPEDEELQLALGELYSSPDYPGEDGLTRAAAEFLHIARAREAAENHEGAVELLRRALGANPSDDEAFRALEAAYQQREAWDELERLYSQRIAASSEQDAATLQMYRADLLLRHLGRTDDARRCYEAALPYQGPVGEAAAQLLDIYREGRHWAKAVQVLEAQLDACTTLDSRVALMLEISATLRDRLDDPEASGHLIHEVMQLQPDNVEAQQAYQSYFRSKGDYRNLVNLQRFLADQQRQAGMPALEVCVLLEEVADISERRLGDLEGAVEAWQQIAELHPDTQKSQEALERLGVRMQSWQQKIQALEREAAEAVSQTQRVQALRRMAKVYFEWQVDPERTMAILQEILELSPQDEHAMRMRVDICEREADFAGLAEALTAQLDGMMTKAERISILRRVGGLHGTKLGNPGRALSAYQALLELNPSDYRVQERVLRLLEETEDLEGLLRFLEQRAQTSRSMARRVESLERVAAIAGGELDDHSRATQAYEQILTLDPDNADAMEALSGLYRDAGRMHDLLALLKRRQAALPEQPVGPLVMLLSEIALLAEEQLDLPGDAVEAYRRRAELLPADRATRDALVRLLGQLGRFSEAAEMLTEQLELAEDPEDRVAIAFRLADLYEERLDDPGAALELLERVLRKDVPGDLDLHHRLRALHQARGDEARVCELAERELSLLTGDPRERTALALEVARMWAAAEGASSRAVLAYERVLGLDPEHLDALQELYELVRGSEAHQRTARVGQALLGALADPGQQLDLLVEMARLYEEDLHDSAAAFGWLRRAHELSGGREEITAELERLTREHGLWDDLSVLLLEQRQREGRPERFLQLTFRVAEICQEELEDPASAFEELVQGLSVDPAGLEVLPRLEALATAPEEQRKLLGVYRKVATSEQDAERRRELLQREASLAEQALEDPGHALKALAALGGFEPDLAWLPEEAERLAERANRWGEVLEIHLRRVDLVDSAQERLSLLWHMASLQEEKAGLKVPAFRTYLQALTLAPEEEISEEHLWRLATELCGKSSPPPVVTETGESIEIDLGSDVSAESIEIDVEAEGEGRGDATQEVDLETMGLEEVDEEGSEGMALTDEDGALHEVMTDDMEAMGVEDLTPGPGEGLDEPTLPDGALPGADDDEEGATLELGDADVLSAELRPGPPRPPEPTIDAWAELAETYRDLPASSPAVRVGWLLRQARVWQEGAGDVERALGVLAEAAALDPEHEEVSEALESLCRAHGRVDDLIRILADSVERATDAGQLLRLELRVADLLLERGREAEAEKHLREALELDPGCAAAEQTLADLLERLQRLPDLAELKARQLRSLERGLEPEALADRLRQLADLHQERLRQPEEATRFLGRLVQLPGCGRDLLLRLANLYQELGEWADLVATLEQISERSLEEDDRPAALAALHRLAGVQQDELELPDRAMEVYKQLLELDPGDRAALRALAELYEQHERRDDLLSLIQQWVELAGDDPAEARPLLVRLARLVGEDDMDAAVAHLQRARAMGEADPALDEELTGLLLRGDRAEEAAGLLQDRLAAARDSGAPAVAQAELLVQLAEVLDAGLERAEDAWGALEQASELAPEHVAVLQAISSYHWRHESWAQYADALERIIDLAPGEVDVDDSLMVTGHVLENNAGDPDRARQLYERVLQRSPDHLPAMDAVIRLSGRSGAERAEQLLRRKSELVQDPRGQAATLAELADLRLSRGASASEAEELFQRALELCDDLPEAVDGLSRLLVEQDRLDAARLLLEDALTRLSGGTASGLLGMRLGEVYQRLGQHAEAFTFLLDAHRKDPEDPMLRLAVGLNRFQLERWREALDYLEPLLRVEREGIPRADLAEALYAGGRSAAALDRAEQAVELLQGALSVDPEHDHALTELAFISMDNEQWSRAAGALDRLLGITDDPARRLDLLRLQGDLRRDHLNDLPGAAGCYEELHSLLGDDDATKLEVLPGMLSVLRSAGRHAAGAAVAEDLAALLDEPRQSSELLLTAAGARMAAGQAEQAASRWREVLALDPSSGKAVEGLTAYLVEQESYEEAAQLAGEYVTGRPPPPTEAGKSRRGRLLRLMARAFRAQGKIQGAVAALEEALDMLGDDLELLEELGAMYGLLPEVDPGVALGHHRRILALDGCRVESLRALAAAALRTEPEQARALYQALRLLGGLDGAGEAYLAGYCPAELDAERPYAGQLIEEDREALSPLPMSPALEEMFQLLWAQAKTLFPLEPEEVGLDPADKVPPMDPSAPALAFNAAARALGRSGAQLFLVDEDHPLRAPTPRVVAMAMPAVVASPGDLEGRGTAELLFLLGRALEATGPTGVLAAGQEQDAFAALMLKVLRAFHPRHMRGRKDLDKAALEQVSLFRRALPFKVARRLGELFRELGSWPFDSARWRQASWHGANRAGLLLCGDFELAARIIAREEGLGDPGDPGAMEGSAALRDLVTFAASEAYPRFRRRLTG